jgi:hypothetical protein
MCEVLRSTIASTVKNVVACSRRAWRSPGAAPSDLGLF